jgi:acetoin utilization deacetylase AcuC-like enzyme
MIIVHDPRCLEFAAPGHPENPDRVRRTAAHLRRLHPDWIWKIPAAAPDSAILRAHSAEHLARLHEAAEFDEDTPAYEGIAEHARRAAGAALECTRLALQGERTFSLMRPPGHHATRDAAMGFCYLNSVAIAALDALAQGLERVSIWDFDGHHGNGTEAICAGEPRIRYVSVHEHPAYPWTGFSSAGNRFNFPLPITASHNHQVAVLRHSWGCVLEFQPQLILVSAGFDSYLHDPLLSLCLHADDYALLGSWLSKSGVPTTAILEGGYSSDLPLLIDAFLTGWEPRLMLANEAIAGDGAKA